MAKESAQKLTEEQLRDNKMKYAPNLKGEGTIEQRLNDASKDFYPHRNPKAALKDGEKRPINSLPKELGSASVEKRDERYDKSNKSAAHNSHNEKLKTKYAGYLDYKNRDVKAFNSKNEKVAKIDDMMSKLMKKAQKDGMTVEIKEIITLMKQKKQELLGQ
jgi:hypothetical protein